MRRANASSSAPAAARGAAFIVACARGRGALLAALPELGAGLGAATAAQVWADGWQRAASSEAASEGEAGVVAWIEVEA